MRLLSSEQMKQVEDYTAKFGLSYKILMENAGTACARNIRTEFEKKATNMKKAAVVCGKGNNGGDGFVIARKLKENGYNVCVILAFGYPTSQEATYMYKLVIDHGIPTVWYDSEKQKAIQTVRSADLIVDAVFGFSFYGELDEDIRLLFKEINGSNAVKFAIDVPSGVYCDSGYCADGCIKTDYTIAISSLKPAHIIQPASELCGDIIIANIGIPEENYSVVTDGLYTYNKSEVQKLFPVRRADSHKGTFGHLLCICGSRTMAGAPVLATSAALRSGAGLVTLAFPEGLYGTVSSKLTEALLMPLPENEKGTLSSACLKELVASLNGFDAVLIGCGLGVNEDTEAVVRAVIENSRVPVIIDADGLNIVSRNTELLNSAACKIVLTPHIGEMQRLTKLDKDVIINSKISVARAFTENTGAYVVLKSSNTVVTVPGEKASYINHTGNTGLSKGGSGDVLAGLIGGFAVQGFELTDAITSAVFVHGYTADAVSERTSKSGMLPSDVVNELAYTLAAFEK